MCDPFPFSSLLPFENPPYRVISGYRPLIYSPGCSCKTFGFFRRLEDAIRNSDLEEIVRTSRPENVLGLCRRLLSGSNRARDWARLGKVVPTRKTCRTGKSHVYDLFVAEAMQRESQPYFPLEPQLDAASQRDVGRKSTVFPDKAQQQLPTNRC